MEYHRRKFPNKKGVSKDWFIDSIDCQTRFMVSGRYFQSRGKKEIKEVLGKIKTKTEDYVTTITTDGWQVYNRSVKQVFGYQNFQKGKLKHNQVNASQGEGFNLYIERLHNSIRERTKVFRGFHGSLESADTIMKGYIIFYNFVRRHQSLKRCPYELATDLKLNSENKWLELIHLSKI
ncbi:MAG: DDE-type integrase/transposase/recombinase, partial [Nanoarchaeota archaeon]|nr:DDE-type integrase/transposase/recombinase [Nanoarchaeota archaeon]